MSMDIKGNEFTSSNEESCSPLHPNQSKVEGRLINDNNNNNNYNNNYNKIRETDLPLIQSRCKTLEQGKA